MNAPSLDVPESARHEVKFATGEGELERVLHWLRMHPAGFASPYPARIVNNVYFDTFDYRAVDEKLAGTSARRKLRYRWYGAALLPQAGVLELKCRHNVFGWKLACPVPHAPEPSDSWAGIVAALRRAVSPEGRVWLAEHPATVLINRYLRRYFLSADGRVRATVDTGLVALDQRYKPRPNVDRPAPSVRRLVLELKFARDDRDRAAELMADVPIRVSPHSKYTLAVEAIAAR